MILDLDEMPRLREIFAELLRGYHVSNEDFGLYHELQDRETRYAALFDALGYRLVSDRRGFYYLRTDDDTGGSPNATTAKMALVVFLLVEHFADLGRDPYDRITTGNHNPAELAEVLFAANPVLLKQAGMGSEDAVLKTLTTSFVRLGFVSINGTILRFRPPVLRFLDVCRTLGTGETPVDLPPDIPAQAPDAASDDDAAAEAEEDRDDE